MQELNDKLNAARKRVNKSRNFKAIQEASPDLLEVMDLEVSLALNRMTADEALSYDEYLSEHGVVKGIRKIRNLMNSAIAEEQSASNEVNEIEKQIKSIKENG